MSWEHITLGDHVEKIGSGITPRGGNSVYIPAGTTLIRSQNVYNNTFHVDGLVYVSDDQAEKMGTVAVKSGDVLLNITGDSVARCCIAPDQQLPARVNQHVMIIRTKRKKINPLFLTYFLTSPFMQSTLLSLAGSGGTRKALTKRMVEKFEIPCPDMEDQNRVVSVLSAYDDLIENNNRRIELLEAVAQQLYKEWFVRFLFPGHEQTKIVDGLPQGWEVVPLEEVADIVMGQSPKSEFYNRDAEGLPFHQGVTNYGQRFVDHQTWCSKTTRIAESGDILFSVRAPVGRINITLDKVILGRGLAAIRSRSGSQSFLFYHLKQIFFKEDMIGEGSIYASISKKDLHGFELLRPPTALVNDYEERSVDIDRQIETLHRSNQRLEQARDLLLPKLMSGEIKA